MYVCPLVHFSDFGAVEIREQKLSVSVTQCICESFVVKVFMHALIESVIPACAVYVKVWWVEVAVEVGVFFEEIKHVLTLDGNVSFGSEVSECCSLSSPVTFVVVVELFW